MASRCFCKVCGKILENQEDAAKHEHLTFAAIRADEDDGEPDFTLDDLEWSEKYE